VSKTSEDLPEPDTPVTTTSSPVGIATLRFLRLFWRAPRMTMASPWICSCFTCGNFTGNARAAGVIQCAPTNVTGHMSAIPAVAGQPFSEKDLEALMRRHNRTLFRTARAILRDDAEAEEAVQDAYLKAFRAMGEFRGDSRISTWLVRIVANEALMRRRKRARGAEIVELNMDIDTASDGEAPEQAAARSEVRVLLESRIDALPDAYRAVFVLRALEEFSVEETALALDLPEATVRTRYFRARGLLREALSREIDHAFDQAFGFDGERCDRLVAGVLAAITKEKQ
jgi:RNA polymerase sigma-70 factor (ECF subfamily)